MRVFPNVKRKVMVIDIEGPHGMEQIRGGNIFEIN